MRISWHLHLSVRGEGEHRETPQFGRVHTMPQSYINGILSHHNSVLLHHSRSLSELSNPFHFISLLVPPVGHFFHLQSSFEPNYATFRSGTYHSFVPISQNEIPHLSRTLRLCGRHQCCRHRGPRYGSCPP
jgi:hypothetical protein